MKEISEIRAAVAKFRNDANFVKLKLRYDQDFDLFRLKPYDAGSGYYSFTTNAPRLLANKVISMITESKLQIRVPEDSLKDADRTIASNVERLLYGILNLVDEDNLSLDLRSVVEQMAWHAVVRGGFAVRPYLYKDKSGQTRVSIAVWDLYNTAYGVGKRGTSWAALSRRASKEDTKAEYDINITGTDSEIIDFCDEKNIGVMVGTQWAEKLQPHGLDHCPTYIIHAGAMPEIWQDKYLYTNIHTGEGIMSSIRGTIPLMNKVLSDYATIVRRGVKVPIGIWSAGGKRTLDEDIYQVDKAAVISLDSNANERIEPLFKPTMPVDAAALVQILSGEIQRGGISHIAQGELGFRLSGFAINQLVGQLSEVVIPFAVAVEKGLKVSLLSILKQYAEGGWQPLSVRGRTSRGQSFGMPQAQMIMPQDVIGSWHPEIRLLPVMPKDDAQNLTMAQMAKQNELLSLDTIQETYMGVADTQLEQSKMSLEWANNLIINRLYKAYMGAVEQGQMDIAENVRVELQRVMMSQGQQSGGKPSPNTTGLEAAAAGMPGAGMPSGETGMPSNVMPSEMGGGLPGGAKNARMSDIGAM